MDLEFVKYKRYPFIQFSSRKMIYMPILLENYQIDDFFKLNKQRFTGQWNIISSGSIPNLNVKLNKLNYSFGFNQVNINNLSTSKLLIFDITPILLSLDNKSPYSIQSLTTIKYLTLKDNRETIFLYSVNFDLETPTFESSYLNHLLTTIGYAKNRENSIKLPNNFILNYVLNNRQTYIPIVVNQEEWKNVNIIKSYISSIYEKNITKLDKKKVIKNISKNVINQDIDQTKTDYDIINRSEEDNIANIDKIHYIATSADLDSEQVSNPNTIKENIVNTLSSGYNEENNQINDYQFKNILNNVIVPQKISIPDTNVFINSLPKQNIMNNRMPTQSVEFNRYEYQNIESVFKNIIDVYKNIENGFNIIDFKIVDVPNKLNEMSKTEKILLILKLRYEGNDNIVKIELPKLLNDGTYLINGNRYISVNQLMLLPITFPKVGSARFSSYTTTSIIDKMKTKTHLYFAGNKLPIGLYLCYIFGFDNVFKYLNLQYKISDSLEKDKINIKLTNKKYLVINNTNFNDLTKDFLKNLFPYNDNIMNIEIDKPLLSKEWFDIFINDITGNPGSSNYVNRIIKIALDNRTKEILSNKNLPTNLFDIMFYMYNNVLKGTVNKRNDIRNMRIRNYETILQIAFDSLRQEIRKYENVKKYNKDAKLLINSGSFFTAIITSPSLQMMDYVNPIEEISSLNKVTYMGYNGITSEGVPMQLRGIHPSYYGIVDPIDVPEGSTTGVNQQLSFAATISTKYGTLIQNKQSDDLQSGILSVSSSTTPFISKNEPTRGIMAANQIRQVVATNVTSPPSVLTGVEYIVPVLSSEVFMLKSPCNGVVKLVNNDKITITCENKKDIEIDISNKFARSGASVNVPIEFTPIVKPNQKIKQGDLLVDSNYIKSGVLSLGNMYLTTYMFWKGYTYEDGVVISSAIANKLTSKHLFKFIMYLEPGDRIIKFDLENNKRVNRGDELLKIASDRMSKLIDYNVISESDIIVNGNKYILISPYNGTIKNIEIFSNLPKTDYNTDILNNLKNVSFVNTDTPYFYKDEKFSGMFIRVSIECILNIGLGDKLTNRHASKGVITYIEDEKNMPKLPDGRVVEVILNPLSVINRTNTGQIYELYSGEISYQLKQKVLSLSKVQLIKFLTNLSSKIDKIGYFKNLITILYNDKKYNEFVEYVKKYSFPLIISPFNELNYSEIIDIMKVLNIPNKYNLHIPEYNMNIESIVGYEYIYKLEHISSQKLQTRSIGPYDLKGQPSQGKKREGGQRIGELDVWSMLSYGADKLLDELLSASSDDKYAKNRMYRDIIENGSTSFYDTNKPSTKTSSDYLNILLKAVMLEV